ncbi:MAG: cyclic nucleotide-binding domain-containing protein [Armatimonadetes bacterium]|nr:cyclic nucleotide-binding domain-containing protein [Armatimonadota bacterium]
MAVEAASARRFGFGGRAPFKMPDGTLRQVPVFYWKGQPLPVILPSARDPRLHFSLVIWGLQIMGQVWLRFETTPALIISTILVAAIFEIYLFVETQGVIQFPSSAMQAANSLTWFVKTNGTRWGDWFSMNGFGFLWLGAFIAIGQKYIIKLRGEQVFNPSAIAIFTLLVLFPRHVHPTPLTWGVPWGGQLFLVLYLAIGIYYVLRSFRLTLIPFTFLAVFAPTAIVTAQIASAALGGGVADGMRYWRDVLLSPEFILFSFAFITDPKVAPRSERGRIVYAGLNAVLWALAMLYPIFTPAEPAGAAYALNISLQDQYVIETIFIGNLLFVQLFLRRWIDARWPARRPMDPVELIWGDSGGFIQETFKGFSEQQARALAGKFVRETVPAGQVIVHQGDAATRFYILSKGEAEVVVADEGGERTVAELRPGHYFGEIAILENTARTATVRARTECLLVSLDAETFKAAVAQSVAAGEDFQQELQRRVAEAGLVLTPAAQT